MLKIEKSAFQVLSVADNIKKYSPELSDNDIKAFVWYNRSLGIPMTGFEEWFIPNTSDSRVTAKEDVDFLNQQFVAIGKFQKHDPVGKVTRFEHAYNGVNYVAVRQFNGTLCMVDKSKLNTEIEYNVDVEILHSLVKSQSLMYLNGMFLPLHVYTNTDYDTLKRSLDKDKDLITDKFGVDIYEYHKFILSGFVNMRIDHPIKDKRYRLNPFGEISRETKTSYADDDDITVEDAFEKWIRTLKSSDFELVSKEEFTNRIIYNNTRTGGRNSYGSEEQKAEQKQQQEKQISDAKLECDRLFSEFCCNVLDHDTVQVLNKKINETYNRSILVNITKVPVGFVSGNLFKAGEFQLKPVQIEAFRFAVSRNNHCLALQVGFGKTSCEIAVLSYMLTTQTVKKPLLVVPKPVMKNWEKELFGYYTDGKQTSPKPVQGYKRHYGILTDCGFEFLNIGNLSKPFLSKANAIRSKKTCITLCSYEALQKMHIADDSIRWFVIDRWMDILSSKEPGGVAEANSAAKDKALSKKISDLIGKLNKIDKDAEISFDKLGIDGLYFDEAHRLKNMFAGVAADKTNRVQSGFSGSPSGRALRAFYLTQYLQKINGRTGFLTATPFSNSPLEVYTMLCFLNYPELVKNNVNKIQSFVEIFFNETLEYKVDSNNKIVSESVMKNYKNKPILFKILSNTFINRGNPDEAGIKRPCIIRYPNKEIKLMLRQSVLQTIQRDVLTGKAIDFDYYGLSHPEIVPYIKRFFEKWGEAQTDSKLGMAGKVLSASKSSALSPFSNSPVAMDFITDEPWRELYVYSPKIKFAVDCIFSISKFHENRSEKESGILVFCGQGINILEPFKMALEKIVGFKRNLSVKIEDEDDDDDVRGGKLTYDEVEIISGSASTDKEANRRERVGELFNQGRVKVIIGTDTIKEGLNLQENCGTLFILTHTWNSTDIQQVEGRIHRQGNSFAFARAITPLVARTLDSFIFQKYDEKTSRLNDIWTDDGISSTENMDVDLKPEKQKELILDDAGEIAKIRAGMLARSEFNALNKIRDEYEALSLALNDSERYRIAVDFYTQALPKVNEIAANNLLILETVLRNINPQTPEYLRSKKARIETLIEYYLDLLEKIQAAINSNLPVDMINIFTGNFKRRGYNLTLGYYDQQDFEKYVAGFGLKNVQNLLVQEIFFSIDITAENTEDFIALFSRSAKAEKFILMPEGLSLASTREELMGIKNKFAQRVMDKEQSIKLNFDIEPHSNALKAKPEYITSLEMTARIELDEENKLAKYGDVLADFFTKKTNIQLTYKPNDIDLKKCDIPYEDVDTDRLSAAFQLDEIQNDHANYKKLYTLLQKVIPAIDTLNAGFYAKSGETGDAIMPLAVEIQQLVKELNAFPDAGPGLALIMEHNYLQNGDLMTDPRIDFALYQKEKMVVPLNYEMNALGTYFEYVQDGKIVNLKGLNDTVKFCYTWFNNLVQQGRIIGTPSAEEPQITEVPAYNDVASKSSSKSKTVQDINTIGDEWFIKNPDKILGDMSISDFRNMIIVKGNKQDVVNYFDRLFSTPAGAVIKPAPAQTEFTPAEQKLEKLNGNEYKTSYTQKATDKPIYLRLDDNGIYVGVVYHNAPYGEAKQNWKVISQGVNGPDVDWEEILPVNNQEEAHKEFAKLSGKKTDEPVLVIPNDTVVIKPVKPKVEKEPKIEKPKEPAPKKEKTPAQQRVFINEQIKALNLVIKYSADKKEKSVINDQIKALKIALKYI